MPVMRSNISGGLQTWTFTSTLTTGSIATTAMDLGASMPIGKYLVGINIEINANIGSSTITAVTIDGKNMLTTLAAAPSLSGAVAAGTIYQTCNLVDIVAGAVTLATTTASSPQYDITVTMTYLGTTLTNA